MCIKINLSPFIENKGKIEKAIYVDGVTVKECLDNLFIILPQLKSILISENNQLESSYNIFLNNTNVYPDGMEKEVHKGDKISILQNISGG